MGKDIQLSNQLLGDFHDKKYKGLSLIEISYIDFKYIKDLYKKNEIEEQVYSFLEKNKEKINRINATISIDYFRRMKYEELIEQACNAKQSKQEQHLHIKTEKKPTEKTTPKADKNMSDTNAEDSKEEQAKKTLEKKKVSEINTLIQETKHGKIGWKIEEVSNRFVVYKIVSGRSELGDDIYIIKRYSSDGDAEYVLHKTYKYTTVYNRSLLGLEDAIINSAPLRENIQLLSSEQKKANLERKKQEKGSEEKKAVPKNAELLRKIEKNRKKREEEKKLEEQRALQKKQQLEQKEKELKRLKLLKQQEEIKKQQKRKAEAEKAANRIKQLPQIDAKSFMVRRSVFKCMHNNHNLQNINAVVNVIDKDCNTVPVVISAGYCESCKIYFILESSYEKLRYQGIPMCRVSDEKNYMKNEFMQGMKLAQESILMQYGYTVSQGEGLSAARRQKILSVMIDNRILSKSAIVSYLDFFISQRQYQSRFEVAITKWEADREYVNTYKVGEYSRIGVGALLR